MPDTPEGKITLAIIATKLDATIDLLKAQGDQLRVIQSCQDKWDHIPGDVENLKKTVGELENDLIAVKERSGVIGALNGVLSVIAGAVGSLFNPKI